MRRHSHYEKNSSFSLSFVTKAPHSLSHRSIWLSPPHLAPLPSSLPPSRRSLYLHFSRLGRRGSVEQAQVSRAAKSTEFVFSMLSGLLARQIRPGSAHPCTLTLRFRGRPRTDGRSSGLSRSPARQPAPARRPRLRMVVAGNQRRGGEFLRTVGARARENSRQGAFFSPNRRRVTFFALSQTHI